MAARQITRGLTISACFAFLGAVAACSSTAAKPTENTPSRYLYVWAGTGHDSTPGASMITVLDANPASATYGAILSALTVDSAGRMPHHSEFALPAKGPLFVNDFTGDKSFLVDFSNPAAPRLAGQITAPPGFRQVHSFDRLANGNVIATMQFGDGKIAGDAGGIAEFDAQGKLVRTGSSRDSAFPGAKIRTYGLTILPAIDRVVTSSSPMGMERTANVVQVWRLSDLTLLKTLQVPAVQGDSAHMFPFELRTLADGRTVLMNTYYCGFFRVTGIDAEPRIERVLTLPLPENIGCSVPLIVGKLMIMPIAYAHRFATIDISDPAHPREVSSFATDSTFFPHWIAGDPNSDRVVFTDQGDGPPRVMMARLDATTGGLTWDERFRDAGASMPGINYTRTSWPNGVKGMAMPHAALFVP